MDLLKLSLLKPSPNPSRLDIHAGKRISVQRIVTSLLIISVVCQLPFVTLAPEQAQVAILLNLLFSIGLFSIVVYLSKQNTFAFARLLLITTFVIFIACSSWLWTSNYHTHWFLLLGIVIVTYLFSAKESAWLYASYFTFSLVFLGFELHFLTKTNDLFYPHLNHTSGLKSLVNSVFMVLSCIAVALNIRGFMDGHWQLLQNRSTQLQNVLDRIFPASCLPETNKTRAQTQHYSNVSILFIDMSAYSEFAATQPTHKHVELLHHAYTEFDQILLDSGIVRIKTNGDQYIAAIGLPCTETESYAASKVSELPHHRVERLCHAAIDIQKRFTQVCRAFEFRSQLKMGMASGDVTAGFIGNLRPTFDVWGEPMIIAARLEKNCPENQILLCPNTHMLIDNTEFATVLQGEKDLKGFSRMPVYRLLPIG